MKTAKAFKRLLILACLSAALCVFTLAARAAIADFGYCGMGSDGRDVMWILDDAGTLTISGSGTMKNYPTYNAPWGAVTGLKKVVVENGVTNVGGNAFARCRELTSVSLPDSLERIEIGAFSQCTSLADVTIPDGVKYIGKDAFEETLWEQDLPDGMNYVGKTAYGFKGDMPENTVIDIREGTTAICSHSFSGYANLTGITIPEGVETIGYFAFQDCTGLTEVTIPEGVTNILPNAFSGCENIINFSLPYSISAIGENAFSGCSTQMRVFYPDAPNEWIDPLNWDSARNGFRGRLYEGSRIEGDLVFDREKTTLLTVYELSAQSVTIPDSVVSLQPDAFDGCEALKEIAVAEDNPAFSSENGVLFDKDKKELIRYPADREGASYDFPETVFVIRGGAFSGNRNLTELSLPSRIADLGTGCFARCRMLQKAVFTSGTMTLPEQTFANCASLREVVVPRGVEIIGPQAFLLCTSLSEITLTDVLSQVSELAFFGCVGLNKVYYQGPADGWEKIDVRPGNEPLTGAQLIVIDLPHARIPGDADDNGRLTPADARLALRASVGLAPDITEGTDAYQAVDVDGDGRVSSADARLILRVCVRLEDARILGQKAQSETTAG